MATIEKLFVQIFDRKKGIIDQAKHQTDFFDQHLATKLLIDGIPPPIWLWNPRFQSQTSAPKELIEEEPVSGALISCPQPAIPYSNSHCSLGNKASVTDINNDLGNVLFEKVHASNKGLDAGCRLSNFLQGKDPRCSSDGVAEVYFSPTSSQDKTDVISDSYQDPAFSLARVQRSKSRQRAFELRNSGKPTRSHSRDKKNVSLQDGGIIGTAIASLQSEHFDEPELLKDINNRVGGMELVRESDSQNKQKKGGTGYSARITRSRSSAQHNSSLYVENSSDNIGIDDRTHADFLDKSTQHSNEVSRQKGTEVFCGRITRSRSSTHQDRDILNCGSQLLEQDDTSRKGKVYEVNIFMQKRNNDDKLRELESYDVSHGSGFHGRITRSMSSMSFRKPLNNVNNLSELDISLDIAKNDGGTLTQNTGNPMSLERSSWEREDIDYCNALGPQVAVVSLPSQNDIEMKYGTESEHSNMGYAVQRVTSRFSASNQSHNSDGTRMPSGRVSRVQKDLEVRGMNLMDYSEKENVAGDHVCWNPKAETGCASEEILQPFNCHDGSGCRVPRSRSTASNKPIHVRSLNRLDGIKLLQVSGNQVTVKPFTNTRDVADLDGCAEIITETVNDSREPDEAWSFSSISNSAATILGVGPDFLPSGPHSDCTMSVKPKQLHFDNADMLSLNEVSSPLPPRRDLCDKPLASGLDPEGRVNPEMDASEQTECNLCLDMPFIEDQKDLEKQEDPQRGLSEANVEKTYETRVVSNGNVVFSKESSKVYENVASYTLVESEKTWRWKVSSLDDSITQQVASENSVGSPLKDVAIASGLSGNPDVFRDVTESPAALMDERMGNLEQQKMSSGISPYQDVDSLGKCLSNYKASCSKSTKRPVTKKSMAPRGDSSEMEASIPDKRRKIDDQLGNAKSASPGVMEEALQFTKRYSIDGNLKNEEDNLKYGLESQCIPLAEADVLQSHVSNSTIKEMYQNEDESSAEEQDKSAHTPLTFINEELDASVISSLIKQAAGDSSSLMEKAAVPVPDTPVFYAGKQSIMRENQVPLDLKDNLPLVDTEHLTCTTMHDKRYCLEGDDQDPYCSFGSPHTQSLDMMRSDEVMPVFEGFLMQSDDEQLGNEGRISFEKLDLSNSTIERASILERLCKSACINTPLSCSSNAYKLHNITNFYKSIPNGLLEGMDPTRSSILINDNGKQYKDINRCLIEGGDHNSHNRAYSDYLLKPNSQFAWDIKKPYTSPVGKLWDRITSKSGSSEKQGSLELPSISEENENVDVVADTFLEKVMVSSVNRVPLAEITDKPYHVTSVSETEIDVHSRSLESEEKLGGRISSKKRSSFTAKENQSIALGANGTNKSTTETLHNRFSRPKLSGKTSLRKEGPRFSEKKTKHSNIVSNIASFIPLVQQKQAAAAVVKGKRDVKVKALEAAEAAKRLAEKKENERKMKKEALKLERARMEQENLRQLEMQRKKKEEERKKKEMDMAAKKRQREEEAKKEKERKRMRVEETRRLQREHHEKLYDEKEDREAKCQAKDEKAHQGKECEDRKKIEKERGHGIVAELLEAESRTTGASTTDTTATNTVLKDGETGRDYEYELKVTCNSDNATENVRVEISEEESYEISPYKGSDDEDDDDDDDIPNNKFIPSWASSFAPEPSAKIEWSHMNEVDDVNLHSLYSFCGSKRDC